MSLHGLTKGSELESMVEQIAKAEAIGAAMYYAFARIENSGGRSSRRRKLKFWLSRNMGMAISSKKFLKIIVQSCSKSMQIQMN